MRPDTLKEPILRMVAEIPPVPASFPRRVAQHARFAETVAEIVRHAGATPLMFSS